MRRYLSLDLFTLINSILYTHDLQYTVYAYCICNYNLFVNKWKSRKLGRKSQNQIGTDFETPGKNNLSNLRQVGITNFKKAPEAIPHLQRGQLQHF